MMRADGELLPRRYGSGERAPSPLAPFVGAEQLLSSLSLTEGEGLRIFR